MRLRYNGRVTRALLLAPLALGLLAGCAHSKTPPPGWQQGGAPIFIPRASLNMGYANIELLADGRVLENGAVSFGIDRAGRVFDVDGQPVALLQPDGRLIGPKNEDLGIVGPVSASPPGAKYAALWITPDGRVLKYDDNGDQAPMGTFVGCGMFAPALQACMLVAYLTATRFQPYQPVNRYYNSPYGYGNYGGYPMMPGFGLGFP